MNFFQLLAEPDKSTHTLFAFQDIPFAVKEFFCVLLPVSTHRDESHQQFCFLLGINRVDRQEAFRTNLSVLDFARSVNLPGSAGFDLTLKAI